MVAVVSRDTPSTGASPKLTGIKGTCTRYRCGFPGCNKRYASTDGVRKHARKTHMSWLKAIDESAGSRDRQLESKPSTYCVMEVTDDTSDVEVENESPAMAPAPMPKIPTLTGMRPACTELRDAPMQMHEGSLLGPRDSISDAMAAATAACLVGAAPPLPLAWLLSSGMGAAMANAHNVMAAAAAAAAAPTPAHALSSSSAAMRSDLPVAVASPPLRIQMPSPLWGEAMSASFAGAPSSPMPPMPPMPPTGAWSPELISLFAGGEMPHVPEDESREEAVSGTDDDPLCLSTYLTPPTSSCVEKSCVSPFELEKRPKLLPPPVPEAKACTTIAEEDNINLFDDSRPMMGEAEYNDFLNTLLAL